MFMKSLSELTRIIHEQSQQKDRKDFNILHRNTGTADHCEEMEIYSGFSQQKKLHWRKDL